MHPLLRVPYAALGAAAELASLIVPDGSSKWRHSLAARRGVGERFRAFAEGRPRGRPLAWFHAPSVGESLQALPLVNRLAAQRPDVLRAYTWFSPSAESFATRFDVQFRDYLPFDTARAARNALDALQPAALIYSKLDVWPVLTAHAAARGVRLGLVSATMAASTSRSGRLARALLRDAYASLDAVGAVSADDAERLVSLGVHRERITVTGDTRYDQAWERAHPAAEVPRPFASLASSRPTLVAGSTWPADERHLTAAWTALRKRVPEARLIVAPHEPTAAHLEPLERWAADARLSCARLANGHAQSADVVLVDRVGVLADLYAAGHVAFVGGGFHPAGIHSVVEPAASGLPVLFGIGGNRNRDAVGLVAAGAGHAVQDAAEITQRLTEWLGDSKSAASAGVAAARFIHAGLGAAERSATLVLGLLP